MNKIVTFNINEKIENIEKIRQIEELCQNKIKLDIKDVDLLLSNLAYIVRKKIADYEGKSISEYSYSYKCDLAQSMIYYYLKDLGIEVNPVNTNEVISGVCGHSLLIASFETEIGKKTFLLDPTYIQFFDKENCDIRKFVIIKDKVCITPDPGFFVVEDKTEDILLPLLSNGYIEFTEQVAKAYGDSFFKTKQGVHPSQIKSNVANGTNYIKWFQCCTSNLSKTEEELNNMNLAIYTINSNKNQNSRHKR